MISKQCHIKVLQSPTILPYQALADTSKEAGDEEGVTEPFGGTEAALDRHLDALPGCSGLQWIRVEMAFRWGQNGVQMGLKRGSNGVQMGMFRPLQWRERGPAFDSRALLGGASDRPPAYGG